MKVAYVVPARNKEKHVGRCVKSVLAQTYPCEILLSDQGSTDGTREILEDAVKSYIGPHRVWLLDCPHVDYRGMVGLNMHLNWLMDQSDADIFVMTSADDITHPERVAKTVEAYEKLAPSVLVTGTYFVNPELEYQGENALPRESGWVSPERCLQDKVGGSTSISWTREFFQKIRPLPAVPGCDVFVPFLATLDKGLYYLHDRLHWYIKHVDPNNTGLEGAWLAAGEDEKLQIEELMHFQVTTALYWIMQCMHANGWARDDAYAAVYEQIMDRAASWCHVRQQMTVKRIAPIPMKV